MIDLSAQEQFKRLTSIKKNTYTKELKPVFEECKKAIVFESSGYFTPYQDVVLHSIIDHISDNNYYDIVILTTEIDDYDCNLLRDTVKGHPNVSLRFYDPHELVKPYMDANPHDYLEVNYYRLALPWIFEDYDVVLNLGADIVVQRDLAELLDVRFTLDEYIAGIIDLGYIGRLRKDISPKELGLQNPDGYVNADVLVFNFKTIRRDFTINDVMNVWKTKKLRCSEQDLFNIIFQGHINYLDLIWNFFPNKMASIGDIACCPDEYVNKWEKAKEKPNIIHYAAYPKPWDHPQVGMGERWWFYARQSLYYEEILQRLVIYCYKSQIGLSRAWIKKLGEKKIFIILFPRGGKFRRLVKWICFN